MLFGRRRRLAKLAKAEAKGRSFWTDALGEKARMRLLYAVRDLAPYSSGLLVDTGDPIVVAQQLTVRELGLPQLSNRRTTDAREDGLYGILDAEESVVYSLVEALIALPQRIRPSDYHVMAAQTVYDHERRLPNFIETVVAILREHRMNVDLIDGRFVPRTSLEMHEAVVVPTLTLLGGREGFAKVEKAYQDALNEIQYGKPEDAITDAGTALQEALVVVGCQGNSLGKLARSAMSKGIVSTYDNKLIHWVSADRSTQGDAHNAAVASIEDAWLTVHVVGAIILRIAGGPPR